MARVKRGVTSHKKHKKLLAANKGYRMTKRRLIKVATEAHLHAGEYAFHGRKRRKRDMRTLWVTRINGQLQNMELKYSRFMNALKKSDIQLDRKTLADLALNNPKVFKSLVDQVKTKIN